MLPLLSIEEMKINLEYFSSFRTRYYNSESGRASSEWLLQKIRNYTAELATPEQKTLISVEPFYHKWKQASVVRCKCELILVELHFLLYRLSV